jgi:hypothetical protein
VPDTLKGGPDAATLASYAYVVVDEIVGDRLGLAVAEWPGIDDKGRLAFAEDGSEIIGARRPDFEVFVRQNRIVMVIAATDALDPEVAADLRDRELRIGDAFAIPRATLEAAKERGDRDGADFAGLEPARIYDLTYEARQRAKLAASASLAPPLTPQQAEEFIGERPATEGAAAPEEPESHALGATPEGTIVEPTELGDGDTS